MRPASARLLQWTTLPLLATLLLASANLAFGQSRSDENRRISERTMLHKLPLTQVAPARAAASTAALPPNTADSWTGTAGDGLWGTAGNWNAGGPNSSNVDVTIGLTTRAGSSHIRASA